MPLYIPVYFLLLPPLPSSSALIFNIQQHGFLLLPPLPSSSALIFNMQVNLNSNRASPMYNPRKVIKSSISCCSSVAWRLKDARGPWPATSVGYVLRVYWLEMREVIDQQHLQVAWEQSFGVLVCLCVLTWDARGHWPATSASRLWAAFRRALCVLTWDARGHWPATSASRVWAAFWRASVLCVYWLETRQVIDQQRLQVA